MEMEFALDDGRDSYSTPKLSLTRLPHCKPRETMMHMQTPPLCPSASIPFRWEETPGKPWVTAEEEDAGGGKAGKCLDLPPRFFYDDAKITIMSSPTTVLDGPDVGRSLSLACTFSFRKGHATGRDEDDDEKDSSVFSHSADEFFTREKGVKVKRSGGRRKKSLFGLSNRKTSNLWVNIYAGFKRVVPWKRRR